jgi:hypothetical protein
MAVTAAFSFLCNGYGLFTGREKVRRMDSLRTVEGSTPDASTLGDLTREGGASTFIRLFTSRHVADLRLLLIIIMVFFVAGAPIVILMHATNKESLIGSPTLATAIIAIALGAVARIYQMGSIRLGVVDLFSCEIITICRVIAVVDSARALVGLYDAPPATAKKFTSEENYSPIFDGNSRDLENLEARVVERVTEFYTYLKTLRDYLRNLSAIEYPDKELDTWHVSVRNSIYMLFLMLESARKSVDQLVEYQPERVLYNAEILISEIVVFGFLWESYKKDALENPEHDARFERLNLRRDNYRPIVSQLNKLAVSHTEEAGPDREAWGKVNALLNELNRCYHTVFNKRLPQMERAHPSVVLS